MIRKPAVAGTFYPGSKFELIDFLNRLRDSALTETSFENVRGIISPHAGYAYSGKTAAYAFNQIQDKNYETVVVIAPSHREYFGGCAIYDGDAYETPLGEIPVNSELRNSLTDSCPSIFSGIEGHRSEHSIEVILPFLQSALGEFSLLPVVMGAQTEENIDALSDALAGAVDEKTLLVASTDLSHFYPRSIADKLDGVFEKDVAGFDFDQLSRDLAEGNCEACGGGPTVALLKAARKLNSPNTTVLNRTDSGETTGDTREVVGYLSAVISD